MVAMERLTWVSGSFPARVLEARLQSEGIDCELRGGLDSPYALTVGDMARVDVFVPADQMDDARFVLLADEVDAAMVSPSERARPDTPPRPSLRWLALAALAAAALAPIVWYLRG